MDLLKWLRGFPAKELGEFTHARVQISQSTPYHKIVCNMCETRHSVAATGTEGARCSWSATEQSGLVV